MIALIVATMLHLSGDESAKKTLASDRDDLCKEAARAEAVRKAACQ